MICKYSGMVDRPTATADWLFQSTGWGGLRVSLEDFRDDLLTDTREWADQVGWTSNWAIAITVHHKNRTDHRYAHWNCLVGVLMEAYGVRDVWLDAGTGTPQASYTLTDLFPDLVSAEGEDVLAPEPPEDAPGIPESVPQPLPPPPVENPEPEPEPEPEIVQEEDEDEFLPPPPGLIPVERSELDEEDDSEDEEDYSWWDEDEDEEDEDEDEEDSEEESIEWGSDAITDWD